MIRGKKKEKGKQRDDTGAVDLPCWKILPLPEGWFERRDKDNRVSYANKKTRQTTWIDPRDNPEYPRRPQDLPYGWEKVDDPEYGVYFIDHNDQTHIKMDPRDLRRRVAKTTEIEELQVYHRFEQEFLEQQQLLDHKHARRAFERVSSMGHRGDSEDDDDNDDTDAVLVKNADEDDEEARLVEVGGTPRRRPASRGGRKRRNNDDGHDLEGVAQETANEASRKPSLRSPSPSRPTSSSDKRPPVAVRANSPITTTTTTAAAAAATRKEPIATISSTASEEERERQLEFERERELHNELVKHLEAQQLLLDEQEGAKGDDGTRVVHDDGPLSRDALNSTRSRSRGGLSFLTRTSSSTHSHRAPSAVSLSRQSSLLSSSAAPTWPDPHAAHPRQFASYVRPPVYQSRPSTVPRQPTPSAMPSAMPSANSTSIGSESDPVFFVRASELRHLYSMATTAAVTDRIRAAAAEPASVSAPAPTSARLSVAAVPKESASLVDSVYEPRTSAHSSSVRRRHTSRRALLSAASASARTLRTTASDTRPHLATSTRVSDSRAVLASLSASQDRLSATISRLNASLRR